MGRDDQSERAVPQRTQAIQELGPRPLHRGHQDGPVPFRARGDAGLHVGGGHQEGPTPAKFEETAFRVMMVQFRHIQQTGMRIQ
jgi:hypothetical protein